MDGVQQSTEREGAAAEGAARTGVWPRLGHLFAGVWGNGRATDYRAKHRAMLRQALEAGPGARAICDASGRIVASNSGFDRLLPRASAVQSLRDKLASGAAAVSSFDRLRTATLSGVAATEQLSLCLDGEERPYVASVTPIKDSAGDAEWRLAPVDPPAAEPPKSVAERASSGLNLVDFVEHAPLGLFSVDRDGRFVFVNGLFARWVGCSRAELLGGARRLHDFLVSPPRDGAAYDLLPGGGVEQQGELAMRASDGREFPAAMSLTVEESDDGAVFHTRGFARDLTPERDYQEALRRSEQRFQRFFDDAPLGIALLGSNGRLTECNRAMAAMLGVAVTDMIGRRLDDILSPDSRAVVAERLAQVAKGNDMREPLEVKLRGDRDATASLYARRFGSGAGDPAGLVLHVIDLTDQKNLEQQFAQSQKMQAVGQLAGGIAHDFNNLLTAMIGFCDLLLLRHKPGDPSFGDIMQIRQNGNRAANLVRQLLAFSRQQTLQPRLLDITDVIAELSHLLRRLIGENIQLNIVHGRDLGLVKVDQGQLEQVLINLAVNARDAMKLGGGKLTIRTFDFENPTPIRRGAEEMPAGKWVAVEVSDTGMGIPKENLSRIFEPFFSTKEVGSGTGLGLSTVYGIVRQTGGFVTVDSAPGAGATFTIYLPYHAAVGAAEAKAPEAAAQTPASDLTGSAKILLVEDEDAVRMFSSRALRNKGYTVLEASSGEAALEVLDKEGGNVDLVVTDVVMPEMDGPTLARRIGERQPNLKVIFISGYTEDKFKHQLDIDAEIHFLAKPFTLKQLAGKVKDVLEQPD